MWAFARWRAGAVLVVVVALGGCSGGSNPVAESAGPSSASEGACNGPTRPGVALDPLARGCADNGFDPNADEFSFPNWGDPGSLDDVSLAALFGRRAVCAKNLPEGCILLPGAQAWMDQVNEAMTAGRCEGMAVLAGRLQDGGAPVMKLQPGAQSTVQLAQTRRQVVNQIEHWWATQLMDEVIAPTAQMRAQQPSALVQTLIEGLQRNAAFTIGLYYQGAGHSVTPFAVSKAGHVYDIAVYDSNFPETVRHILVDEVSQVWTYDIGAVNPSVTETLWSGQGPGSLEMTAMSWRERTFTAPFEESGTHSSPMRTILVTGGVSSRAGTVGARVTVGSEQFDTTNDATNEIVAALRGGSVTVIKAAGTIVGVQLLIPESVGEVVVEPVINDGTASPPNIGEPVKVRVSVDEAGQPRVTTRGRLMVGRQGFVITSRPAGNVQVTSGAAAGTTASVAFGHRSLTSAVPVGATMDIGSATSEGTRVVLTDGGGSRYDYLLMPNTTENRVEAIVADISSGTLVTNMKTIDEKSTDAAGTPIDATTGTGTPTGSPNQSDTGTSPDDEPSSVNPSDPSGNGNGNSNSSGAGNGNGGGNANGNAGGNSSSGGSSGSNGNNGSSPNQVPPGQNSNNGNGDGNGDSSGGDSGNPSGNSGNSGNGDGDSGSGNGGNGNGNSGNSGNGNSGNGNSGNSGNGNSGNSGSGNSGNSGNGNSGNGNSGNGGNGNSGNSGNGNSGNSGNGNGRSDS